MSIGKILKQLDKANRWLPVWGIVQLYFIFNKVEARTIVADWTWWQVLLPTLAPTIFLLIALFIGLTLVIIGSLIKPKTM